METVMHKLCDGKSYVSIYDDDNDTDKFKFGRLLCVNSDQYAILMISPNGDYDGIGVESTYNVFRVETEGDYHDKMQKLLRFDESTIAMPTLNPKRIDVSVLSFARNVGRIVALELNDSGIFDVVGFVRDVSDTICTVRLIDKWGFEDALTYVRIDSITKISFDTDDEQRLLRLYNANTVST